MNEKLNFGKQKEIDKKSDATNDEPFQIKD